MLVPNAKRLVDPVHEKREPDEEDARPTAPGRVQRASRALSAWVKG